MPCLQTLTNLETDRRSSVTTTPAHGLSGFVTHRKTKLQPTGHFVCVCMYYLARIIKAPPSSPTRRCSVLPSPQCSRRSSEWSSTIAGCNQQIAICSRSGADGRYHSWKQPAPSCFLPRVPCRNSGGRRHYASRCGRSWTGLRNRRRPLARHWRRLSPCPAPKRHRRVDADADAAAGRGPGVVPIATPPPSSSWRFLWWI